MGKLTKGILGGFSGTVGNVIGGNWKGIDYMRSKPDHVSNPNTPKQREQRYIFKGCTEFVRSLLHVIVHPIWNQAAVKMSGYNLMVQKNMAAFNANGMIEDFAKVVLTVGPLDPPSIKATVDATNPMVFDLTWKMNPNSRLNSEDDILHIASFDPEDACITLLTFDCAAIRKDETFRLDLSTDQYIWPGCIREFYFYFASPDNSKFSDSQHLAILVAE
jgi:hypothetical protein